MRIEQVDSRAGVFEMRPDSFLERAAIFASLGVLVWLNAVTKALGEPGAELQITDSQGKTIPGNTIRQLTTLVSGGGRFHLESNISGGIVACIKRI